MLNSAFALTWSCVAFPIMNTHLAAATCFPKTCRWWLRSKSYSTSFALPPVFQFPHFIPKQPPTLTLSILWAALIPDFTFKSPKHSRKLSSLIWHQTHKRVDGNVGRGEQGNNHRFSGFEGNSRRLVSLSVLTWIFFCCLQSWGPRKGNWKIKR